MKGAKQSRETYTMRCRIIAAKAERVAARYSEYVAAQNELAEYVEEVGLKTLPDGMTVAALRAIAEETGVTAAYARLRELGLTT